MIKFSKKEILINAWKKIRRNLRFFIFATLLIAIVGWFPDFVISKVLKNNFKFRLFLTLINVYLSSTVTLWYLRSVLSASKNKKLEFKIFSVSFRQIAHYLIAEVISGLLVIIGFIIFIVPGIILSLKFQFTNFFIVDQGLGPIAAMKKSWMVTKGVKLKLLIFDLTLILLNLIGLLVFGFGLLVSYPMTLVAQVILLNKLKENLEPK